MDNRTGNIELIFSYIFGIAHVFSKDNILFSLSAIASVMAIINYYIQIKKNRTK